jgi:hypothetical protein
MLRKPDSALALGLFEHYFKLEVRTTMLPFLPHGELNALLSRSQVQVPGGGGGAVERQAFLIPQTYSVDQVKVRGVLPRKGPHAGPR